MKEEEKQALVRTLKELVESHGHAWNTIATILNDRNINPPRGDKWTAGSVRLSYKRHVPETNDELPTSPQTLPKQLDATDQADIIEMLKWWREHKAEPLMHVQQRPVFKGGRRNTGIHANETILELAMQKLKRERAKTGGSLSLLVEMLLWEYVGRPADILESSSSGDNGENDAD